MSQATVDSAQNTPTAGEEASAPASGSIQETNNSPTGNNGTGGSGEMGDAPSSLSGRASSIKTPADFEALMAEIQQNPNAFATAPEKAPAQEAQEEQPTQEDNQEAQVLEGQEVEVSEEGAGSEEDEGDEEKHPQFRLRPTDKLDAEAMRIKKAADAAQSPISLSEALEIAKRRLGIEDPAPIAKPDEKSPEAAQEEGDDPAFEGITLADAKQELKDLRKAHAQALRDGDLDEAADAMEKITETEDLIEVLAEKEKASAAEKATQLSTAFESSVAKATDLYPDFANEGSEFYQRCAEIDQALKDTEDPRYFDAEKPLLVARMAARELNIAPKSTSRKAAAAVQATQPTQQVATPQQTTISPQPPRTEKPGQLPAASGASRTTGASTGAAASLAEQVVKIKSPEDFERLAAKVHAVIR